MRTPLFSFLLFCLAAPVYAQSTDFVVDGIAYHCLSGKEVEVGRNATCAKTVIIPATVRHEGRKYRVVSMGDMAFYSCETLQTIQLPKTLTNIGEAALAHCIHLAAVDLSKVESLGSSVLSGCTSLQYVKFPKHLDTIPPSMVSGCKSLEYIELPSSVKSIGNWAFSGTAIRSLQIPEGVESVHSHVFSYCDQLQDIVFPQSTVYLGDYMFSWCNALRSVFIPRNVREIKSTDFFFRCDALRSVTVDGNNPVYDSRDGCNAIIETATNILIASCPETVLPEGISPIPRGAQDNVLVFDDYAANMQSNYQIKITSPRDFKAGGHSRFSIAFSTRPAQSHVMRTSYLYGPDFESDNKECMVVFPTYIIPGHSETDVVNDADAQLASRNNPGNPMPDYLEQVRRMCASVRLGEEVPPDGGQCKFETYAASDMMPSMNADSVYVAQLYDCLDIEILQNELRWKQREHYPYGQYIALYKAERPLVFFMLFFSDQGWLNRTRYISEILKSIRFEE